MARALLVALTLFAAPTEAGWTRAALEKEAERAAAQYGVPAHALKAICTRESNWNPTAIGAVGEIGLCQLRPTTVLMLYGPTWRAELPQAERLALIRQELFNPVRNLQLAARYMRWMIREAGDDLALAIAGYNAGPGAIRYVRRVQTTMETYE